MEFCWSHDSAKRPTFDEITSRCAETFHSDEGSEFYYGPARQSIAVYEYDNIARSTRN
jgi:hypothetical protein